MENLKNGTEMIVQIYKRKLIYEGADDLIDKETTNSVEVHWLMGTTIEILSEEDEEIDIQSIEGLPLVDDLEACEPNEYNIQLLGKKYNELLKIVKQLDKKIKEKE